MPDSITRTRKGDSWMMNPTLAGNLFSQCSISTKDGSTSYIPI